MDYMHINLHNVKNLKLQHTFTYRNRLIAKEGFNSCEAFFENFLNLKMFENALYKNMPRIQLSIVCKWFIYLLFGGRPLICGDRIK